jgi:hypothetical protein
MLFTALEPFVRRRIGQDVILNIDTLLRDAENDYCRRTWCKEKIDSLSTLAQNAGVLAPTYALPSDFVREFRIEWNGIPLDKAHIREQSQIYDSALNNITGTPTRYWIENGYIRLIPMPSSHGYLTRWYAIYNTDTDSLSPIIPDLEQKYLCDYVIADYFEGEDFNKQNFYWSRYRMNCHNSYVFYRARRAKQKRIADATYQNGISKFGVGAPIVQEIGTTTTTTVKETLHRSGGIPATGDPKDLFQAQTDIVHTSVLTTYLTVPVVVPVNKSDWPIFIKSVSLLNGIVTITVGVGGMGSAIESDFDYDLNIF